MREQVKKKIHLRLATWLLNCLINILGFKDEHLP